MKANQLDLLLGERGGVALEHLRHDVDALRLQVGFFRRASDVDLHRHRDLRVERDLDLVHADRLDRPVEHDLALRHLRSNAFQRLGDIAGANRAVELPGVRRLADQLDELAVDVLGRLLGVGPLLGIVGLDALAAGFEQFAVAVVGAQRLFVGQQVIAGKAVLDPDHIADGAEVLDPLKQNDFHVERSLISRCRVAGRGSASA